MRTGGGDLKCIYFLRRKDGIGPVKIGCSLAPRVRLSGIELWSPYPLELMASVPGGHDIERKLHSRFADHHFHHEWFHPAPELLEAIRQIAAGVAIADAVDLTINKGSIRSAATSAGWVTRKAKREAA